MLEFEFVVTIEVMGRGETEEDAWKNAKQYLDEAVKNPDNYIAFAFCPNCKKYEINCNCKK